MVKYIILCDRCGRHQEAVSKMERVSIIYQGELKNMDFCGNCLNDIKRYMEKGNRIDIGRYMGCGKNAAGRNGKSEEIQHNFQNGDTENKNEDTENGNTDTQKQNGSEEKVNGKPEKKVAAVPKRRGKTDYGKILALANAGWDNAKIADEMGMTPQQVAGAKYAAKKKLENGTLTLGGDNHGAVGGC